MGVDRLFIDESHFYKNLYLYTKMRNVGGIAQTEAQKSSDLFMKCRYLDEITGNRGTIFATGTPISNSMVELYSVQRYLQYDTLMQNGLQHFDSWASTFGETVTALELAPEGTNYRAKTRFAKFFNLPELLMMFREVADIQTADMLKLPVPKVNYHNIKTKPSEIQTDMVAGLAKRAEKVRARLVEPNIDNMLKITNDGRKLALDQRMIDPMLPDDPNIKVREYSFVEAVEMLTGITADWKPPPVSVPKDEPKVLLLPPKNRDCNRVTDYLFGRGIDLSIIQDCIADGTIFESVKYHNAVFVGKDESGTPKYAAYRSTIGSSFKGDASGSDKRYSFRLLAREPTNTVHLFEAAIDLLSYATYLKCEGKDYKSENLLSLSGVYQPKKEIKDSKIPIALTTFLNANPHIKTIILHLDNDKTGRICTATLKELLQKDYQIVDDPPPVGKDFNDFLLSYLGIARPTVSRERSDAR